MTFTNLSKNKRFMTAFAAVFGLIIISCSDSRTNSSDSGTEVEDGRVDAKTETDKTSSCGPQSCSGCCRQGHCHRGLSDERCGSDGVRCSSCAGKKKCRNGECLRPGCGNGVLDDGEECDDDTTRKSECSALGFESGELRCHSDCTYDTSQCEGDPCKVEQQKPREEQNCIFCQGDRLARCSFGLCSNEFQTNSIEDCSAKNKRCVDTEDGLENIGAACVFPQSEQCDASNFEDTCADAETVIRCANGFTREQTCRPHQTCETIDGTPYCVGEESKECSPEKFTPRCDDQSVITCLNIGRTQSEDCIAEENCENPENDLPRCVNPTLGGCSSDAPDTCHKNRRYGCRDGKWVLLNACDSDQTCSEIEQTVQGDKIKLARCVDTDD